jgi:hypothetical protein
MVSGGCDSLVGVGLRSKRDESDIGDLVDGLAAYLRDLFAVGYRYEEVGSRDLEKAWCCISSTLVSLCASSRTVARIPITPCASTDTGAVSSSRLSFNSGPTLPL